jgi:hypothetical protein
MLNGLFNEARQRAKFSVLRVSLRPKVLCEGSDKRRMRYGDKSRFIVVLPSTDGLGAGGPSGNRRRHSFGLFSRLSSTCVMRSTTLSTSFVRPTAMWFRLWRTRKFVRRVPQHVLGLLRHTDRNSRGHHARHSCAPAAKIPPEIDMWAPDVSSAYVWTALMRTSTHH